MPQPILFYISGHGFGHARRMGLVIQALLREAPDIRVHVRTTAPRHVFEAAPSVTFAECAIDAGMAEAGPLAIDRDETLRRLVNLVDRRETIVADEVTAVRALRPTLIVADIPFLAGHVAAATGIPCVGISNFTWDWICDPLLTGDPRYEPVRRVMREGYAHMQSILKLPFGKVAGTFAKHIDVPLIAGRSHLTRQDVRERLGVDAGDDRPIVLVALRGGVPAEAIRAAADDNPACWFLTNQPGDFATSANVLHAARAANSSFADLVAGSDIVIAKLGYGIVADCLAADKALLWPRRRGFREDEVVEAECPRYMRMLEIAHEPFFRGDWRTSLAAIAALPQPRETIRTDGAEVCARNSSRWA